MRQAFRGPIIAGSILLALLFSWIAVGVIAFTFPADDQLSEVDAVFVLGPATHARIEAAERIVAERGGNIPLIISKPNNSRCYVAPRICVAAKPATTAGEAAALHLESARLGFKHPVVVTFTPHVARARYIFQKCYGDDAAVIGVREDLTLGDAAFQIIYQTAAFAKAAASEC